MKEKDRGKFFYTAKATSSRLTAGMVRLMQGFTMRKLLYVVIALFLVVSALGATGVVYATQTRWFIDESKLPFTPIGDGQALWGVHAGAGYRIEVPEDWNGDLVLYAHGYRGTGLELTVSNPSIRDHLIAQGYAWAASSFSANGYVPGIGAQDTHKLLGLFKGLVGNPRRVYIAGHSMGGHVTGVAIEQWPKSFDGALPMCGVMGDNELFDFFQDAYLLAETLAWDQPAEVPTPADYFTTEWPLTQAELGTPFPVLLTPAGEQYKTAVKYLTGGERPTFDEGFAFSLYGGAFIFYYGSATTGPGRDNIDTVYQLDDDPALSAEEIALNEMIPRIAAQPQYRHPNGLGILPGSETVSPPISGDIRIPVLSMHTLGELFVPFSMEQIYAKRVAAHGASDLLVTRAIRDVNHCGFSLEEQEAAFDALVNWVENGVKPAGDDVLDPAAVAEDDYGCQFTYPDRPGLPPCP
ncbi:MAG: prolyl oligopeptidase family serine peptidase [Deltaproteobacteria bacterium]